MVPLPVREGELEGKIEPLPPVRMTEEEFRRSHRPARLRKEDMELLPVVVEEEEE
ncbi:MAG: hypothetical protein RMI00_06490 [Sulfolobales archaeon]|nr:hypothetical protein [Sulfolobales archaeon]